MKQVKEMIIQIETNRQRLHHALQTENSDLINRTSLLLTHLLAAYFDETKGFFQMKREKKYLVFCDEYLDGIVVNETGYQNLVKTMNRFDRETHIKIEVPDGTEMIADEMIEISSMPKPWKTDRKGA